MAASDDNSRLMDSIPVIQFECHGVRYDLARPINLQVEYVDSLWVFHNEALNLWGHGERREDAMRNLNENFAFLWREYADENDDLLDDAARELKKRLRALCKDATVKVE